ncbi:GNAT family N-acetyltransferase [Chryseobacterium oryctis]|uniref:GNAT family N-acetyltransferase n=1 Tax=Chryseobacterium oryctis TaxID=2952618 RepID=A0ABT3HSG4_9FLAO|nr:GNAT family N-acetyltransferase [Chryseobacterium oryctis]MCW3162725.1 GNAT family N-acetyltransferase [Chryseobacterium oryctis]
MIIKRTDSSDIDFQKLVRLLDAELAIRNGEDNSFFEQFNKIDLIKNCVIIYIVDIPVACGAFKEFNNDSVEIKRMFTNPEFRRKGLATKILEELEIWAKQLGYEKAVLETLAEENEAVFVYQKNGYKRIPNYGQYVGIDKSACFEKVL